jgi:hypothetical protein
MSYQALYSSGIDQLLRAQPQLGDLGAHEQARSELARQGSLHQQRMSETTNRGSAQAGGSDVRKAVVKAFLNHKKAYSQLRRAEVAELLNKNKVGPWLNRLSCCQRLL